ncbi:histidine kinase, partial [Achromobacter xylosoxidans]
TPLAAIRSDSELMLLTQDLTADQRQRLTRVMDNVDDVIVCLESARAMARDQMRPPEPVDLADCMQDAWRGYESQAGVAQLRFDNRIPPEHIRILDRYALLTVLRNLVRNAIEHAAPATLTASLGEDGVLQLGDDGKGIDAGDLPFLFRRYYSGRLRDSAAAGRDETARGLGLAIAKRVCDMQGWTLTVDSSREGPQRGTRFSLRLNAADATA